MTPTPISYTTYEDGDWRPWDSRRHLPIGYLYAIRFSDGSIFRQCSGWDLCEQLPPGPTPTTPAPKPPPSESATPTASLSFERPEDILLQALNHLRKWPSSLDLNLNEASGQLNFSLQGSIQTSAAGVTAPPRNSES